MSNNQDTNWKNYCKKTSDISPRPTLLKVLSYFEIDDFPEQEKVAIDLGCGAGIDSIKLLESGWFVHSIDKETDSINSVKLKASKQFEKLQTEVTLLEEISSLPKSLLVNASLSLPFCKPQYFNNLWEIIKDSIISGGRFSGHFFGVRDEWAANKTMSFFRIEEVYELFSDFDIEYFHERDEIGSTATAGNKHWHCFSIVARKVKPPANKRLNSDRATHARS